MKGSIADGGEVVWQGDVGEGITAVNCSIAGQGDGGLVGSGHLACTARSLAW